MSARASSSISSTSYQSVRHKKNRGTIILNDANFTFYPAAGGGNGKARNQALSWVSIAKHQVSPITHPRFLLKIVLLPPPDATSVPAAPAATQAPAAAKGPPKTGALTFEFESRDELERIRQDVSVRLTAARKIQAQNAVLVKPTNGNSRKRGFDEMAATSTEPSTSSSSAAGERKRKLASSASSSPFTVLSDTSLAITCSSLLSSNSTLRMHYSLLVLGQPPSNAAITSVIDYSKLQLAPILSENDFWFTHKTILANHSAKIFGTVSYGISSAIKSSLDLADIGTRKPIHLGVEEMRQIFILYPAVHKAYEAMVPLELSEEQFWRKYLESEYFHRDRGRLNTHFGKRNRNASSNLDKKDEDGDQSQQQASSSAKDGSGDGSNTDAPANTSSTNNGEEAKTSEENARIAAASSNDIFSRAELELQTKHSKRPALRQNAGGALNERKGDMSLAIGQFDLAATANTERGSKLLLYSNELNRPPNENTKGSKVIEKYNRHWAVVMNPEIATAGCNLMELARESVNYNLDGDDDAKVAGGVGKEMQRLVGFASAREGRVDHVKGMGDPVDDEKASNGNREGGSSLFQELNLRSLDLLRNGSETNDSPDNLSMVVDSVKRLDTLRASKEGNPFPEPKFGRDLLSILTKRMKQDSVTESDTIRMTDQLDETFRKKLILYFHRATELLKHFFALRRVMETEKRFGNSRGKDGRTEKINKVADCMKQVYVEMDEMRKDLPEMMRVMCFPIMSQLDFACKKRISGDGDGGGFVTVGL